MLMFFAVIRLEVIFDIIIAYDMVKMMTLDV